MEISFCGIKNLYIGKKAYSEVGVYANKNCVYRRGKQEFTDTLIKCDLTDDAQGNHLSLFKETLAKCRPCYQAACINKENPNRFRMLMSNFNVKGDTVHVGHAGFKINDYDIMLDEPQILPLFSFMAKITRDIANSQAPAAYKETAKNVNTTLHNKVMDYIDNRM